MEWAKPNWPLACSAMAAQPTWAFRPKAETGDPPFPRRWLAGRISTIVGGEGVGGGTQSKPGCGGARFGQQEKKRLTTAVAPQWWWSAGGEQRCWTGGGVEVVRELVDE
jgi:hypothetical protein